MARNGSGTYSLYTPGNPVVTGTTISSTAFNNTMNDIATALTGSVAADGQTPITANIPMASHKITGLAAGTTSGDALAYGQTQLAIASGAILAGTYTPTLANLSNLASSSATLCQYMRVGNVVTVSGNFTGASTVAGNTSMTMTLPVSSTFTQLYQAGGGGAASGLALAFYATTSAQTVTANWVSSDTGSNTFGFSFTYVVL